MLRNLYHGTFFVLMVSLIVGFSPAVPAQAHSCLSTGMPSKSFRMYYAGNPSSSWRGILDQARSNWNNAGVGASIGMASSFSTHNNFSVGDFPEGWYGFYTRGYTSKRGYFFTAKVNARTLRAHAPSGQYVNWSISTASHELGHALKLRDNPNTSASSLMKHSRNRSTVKAPTSYDKNNVRACYR